MKKLGDTKDKDADDGGIINNKNSVGEKSKSQGKREQVILRKIMPRVDQAEEDAQVFKHGNKKEGSREKDV